MSEFPLVIRLCELEDTPQIVTMIQAQVAAAGRQAPDPDALAELVHALLSTQFSDFILAELEGRTVGVLQINMLDYACARAEGRGSTLIQSSVRAEDWAARRLYEAFGFTATPQSLWRSDLPLGCAVPTDEPAADEQTETSNQ